MLDTYFKEWILHPDRDANLYWEEWLANNTHKVGEVKRAREILLGMERVDHTPSSEVQSEVWSDILAEIDEDNTRIIPMGPGSIIERYDVEKKPHPFKSRLLGVAASLILLMVSYVVVDDFEIFQVDSKQVLSTIEKSNPRGQKSTIFLPDGTKVFLNSESSVSYTSDYGESARDVMLKGEAFFEVVKDVDRPFTVTTGTVSTTALGTSFNINYYTEDVEVALMTGKVRVEENRSKQELILLPGERSLSDGSNLIKEEFDLSTKALWRKGVLHFDDTSFDEVLHQLGRWYGVEFTIKGDYSDDLICSGRFDKDYLSSVLNSLGYSLGFQHTIEGKNVTIEFN